VTGADVDDAPPGGVFLMGSHLGGSGARACGGRTGRSR
jgi:hypothetical protein